MEGNVRISPVLRMPFNFWLTNYSIVDMDDSELSGTVLIILLLITSKSIFTEMILFYAYPLILAKDKIESFFFLYAICHQVVGMSLVTEQVNVVLKTLRMTNMTRRGWGWANMTGHQWDAFMLRSVSMLWIPLRGDRLKTAVAWQGIYL